MVNKLKEYLEKIKFDKKKIIIAIGFMGIALILLSEVVPQESSKSQNTDVQTDYNEYVSSLEEKTADLISSIDGVGKCKVMITLEQSDENIFAKNTDESTNSGSYSKKSEYVLYEDNNNDTPVLVKQYFPKVKGVAVVCTGGDDVIVKEKVISSISSLFGISGTKISVSKINR